MKKTIFFFLVSLTYVCIANKQDLSFSAFLDYGTAEQYRGLPAQKLLDTGRHLYRQNDLEGALDCYNLLFEIIPEHSDIEQQKILTEAYHSSAIIHYYMSNLRISYELALKALELSEMVDETKNRSGIFIVLGNIYSKLDKPDLAKTYFKEAMNIRQDSSFIALVLNNLGSAYIATGDLDDAFSYIQQSLQIAERHRPNLLDAALHTMAMFYKGKKVYDSAFLYFKLSMEESKKTDNYYAVCATFSDLGKLFFALKQPDSAIFYINLSSSIAREYDFKAFLMENYLTLSEIAEYKGQKVAAFEYFKQYSDLKNSMFSHEKIVEINLLQRLYEVKKTNQRIEKLTMEQQLKNQSLRYLKIMLVSITLVLILVFFQNRRLKIAYRKLFEKNIEIVELQDNSPENLSKKYQKSHLSDSQQSELISQINTLMQDPKVICDPEFSIEKLADMLQTNRTYVSQVINETMHKNFRTLVNDYRIREAQRLFSELDTSKYTIESVSLDTGFKSRTSFIAAFKEFTGVSPSFYLKSMLKR